MEKDTQGIWSTPRANQHILWEQREDNQSCKNKNSKPAYNAEGLRLSARSRHTHWITYFGNTIRDCDIFSKFKMNVTNVLEPGQTHRICTECVHKQKYHWRRNPTNKKQQKVQKSLETLQYTKRLQRLKNTTDIN